MADTAETKTRATVMCQFCLTMNRVDLARVQDRPKCGSCGKPMLLDRPIKVTDNSLQPTVKGTDVPVLVDFWADWCQPCKMMAPVLDRLAQEYQGRLLVAKLDTDSNPTMAVHYAIRGIPTLIVFREGREWKRQTGVVGADRLVEMLEL